MNYGLSESVGTPYGISGSPHGDQIKGYFILAFTALGFHVTNCAGKHFEGAVSAVRAPHDSGCSSGGTLYRLEHLFYPLWGSIHGILLKIICNNYGGVKIVSSGEFFQIAKPL